MFTINNHLLENSFQYDHTNGTNWLGSREDDLFELQEIWDYCRINGEMLQCDLEAFYDIEVEPGISLCDWVFGNQGTGSHDARSMLLHMLDAIRNYEAIEDREISVSLGSYENCVGTVNTAIFRERIRLACVRMPCKVI